MTGLVRIPGRREPIKVRVMPYSPYQPDGRYVAQVEGLAALPPTPGERREWTEPQSHPVAALKAGMKLIAQTQPVLTEWDLSVRFIMDNADRQLVDYASVDALAEFMDDVTSPAAERRRARGVRAGTAVQIVEAVPPKGYLIPQEG